MICQWNQVDGDSCFNTAIFDIGIYHPDMREPEKLKVCISHRDELIERGSGKGWKFEFRRISPAFPRIQHFKPIVEASV